MLILIIVALSLYFYGRKVRYKYMYQDGYKTKFLITVKNLKSLSQDDKMYVLGGYTLEFSGIIMLISVIFS
jgi:hypothetical protein